MKMIQAILRPEKLKDVEERLKGEGFIGEMRYDKLPKELLVVTCKDGDLQRIVDIILEEGRTGNIGDGKIFVLNVEDAITIREGRRGEAAL